MKAALIHLHTPPPEDPPSITRLKAILSAAKISEKKILSIPRNLNFGDHGAKLVAKALANSTKFTTVWIAGEEISPRGAEAIGRGLKRSTTMRQLDISSNPLGDEGIEAIAEAVERCETMTSLDVSHCAFGRRGGAALRKMLETCRNMQRLYMRENEQCTSATIAAIVRDGVAKSRTLQLLDLSHTLVGDDGARELANVLTSPQCVLKSLLLVRTGIQWKGAIALGEALERNRTLQQLELSNNPIDPDGMRALAKGVDKTPSSLMTLVLRNMGVFPAQQQALMAVVEAACRVKTMSTLDLGENSLEGLETSALATMLTCEHLTKLDLSSCRRFSLPMMTTLSRALSSKGNSSLTHLNVSFNEFEPNVAVQLVEGIAACRSLCVLNLAGCDIGDEGARVLGAALAARQTIQELNVTGCEITSDGRSGLLNELCKVCTLCILVASDNPLLVRTLDEEDVRSADEEFARVISANPHMHQISASQCGMTEPGAFPKTWRAFERSRRMRLLWLGVRNNSSLLHLLDRRRKFRFVLETGATVPSRIKATGGVIDRICDYWVGGIV